MWFNKSRTASSVGCLAILVLSIATTVSNAGHALLIAFPDYQVSVDKGIDSRLDLGHAGILLVSKTGVTNYYEFGRYDHLKEGKIRSLSVPNIRYSRPGDVNRDSVLRVLKKLSDTSGQRGKILGAYVSGVDYGSMMKFVQNSQREYPKYHWYTNNCATFASEVLRAGNPKSAPWFRNAITSPEVIVRDYILHGAGEVRYEPGKDELSFRAPGKFFSGLFTPSSEVIRLK